MDDSGEEMPVKVVGWYSRVPVGARLITATNCSAIEWQRELSPLFMGPIETSLYLRYPGIPRFARRLCNAYQYSKVYRWHLDVSESRHSEWVAGGFNSFDPQVLGGKPLFSVHVDPESGEVRRLSRVEARRKLLIPMYMKCVHRTRGFQQLARLSREGDVYIRDFDSYELAPGQTFDDVVEDATKRMGHSFILANMI